MRSTSSRVRKRFYGVIAGILVAIIIFLGFLIIVRLTGYASFAGAGAMDVCQDSDGGDNPDVYGFVSGVQTSFIGVREVFIEKDKCADFSNLVEWSCTTAYGGYVKISKNHLCQKGCANGACVKK